MHEDPPTHPLASTSRPDWRSVARRVAAESKEDRLSLLAAGVAFYSLLAIVPTLLAVVSVYGLVADPNQVERQIQSATRGLPPDARHLLATQLHQLAAGTPSGLGVSTVVGIVVALWSASAGIKHLIDAVNVATEVPETRGLVRLRVTAFVVTLGAIVFVAVAAGFLVFLPAILRHTALGTPARVLVAVVRFPLLALMMLVGLSLLYRYGPDRPARPWRWASWGAAVATAIWIVGSVLFTLYTSYLGHFNQVYGSLGAVIVVMLWLLLTAASVILGAELDNELEKLAPGQGSATTQPREPAGDAG